MATRRAPLRWALALLAGGAVAMGCEVLGGDGDVENTDFVAEARFDVVVDAAERQRVRIEAVNGTIEVEGLPGAAEVVVSGVRRVGSDSQGDAREHLDDLEVQVQERQDEVFIRTMQPQDAQGRSYVVAYRITLPDRMETLAGQVNGDVTIEALTGRVDVESVNGDVTLRDLFGSASVELVNGTIDGRVTLPESGVIDLAVVNGTIDLAIPVATSAGFSASVTNGRIRLNDLTLQNQVSTNTSLQGTLGAGAGTIDLRTVNGNIDVTGFE